VAGGEGFEAEKQAEEATVGRKSNPEKPRLANDRIRLSAAADSPSTPHCRFIV
jgi:hypothetical protein